MPGRTALVDGPVRLSFAELDAAVDRLAGGLHARTLEVLDRAIRLEQDGPDLVLRLAARLPFLFIAGRIYGAEALGLALQFAFQELNLHRVQLTVFSYNQRAIALYEKLGFQREGIFREHLERDGTRFDMYLYGILRPEWLAAQI